MKLDADSPLPRHFQLREAIRRDTLRNGLSNGDPIPSERELGKQYGVSRVTVRRAIADLIAEGFLRREGRRGTFINDVTRVGSWMPSQESRLIGVIISRIQTSFSDRLLGGIDDCCHDAGYSVVFGATDEDPQRAARQIERMATEGVAGFILVPVAGDDYFSVNNRLLNQIRAFGLPFVLLDRYIKGSNADTVVSDNFDGAYRATKHLIDQGHRTIAFVGYPYCSSVSDRIAGYEKCLMDAGIAPDDSIVVSPKPDEVKSAVNQLMRKRPDITAIFAVSDPRAVLVWESLTEMGLRVPTDVALVGYDNLYGSAGPGALLTTTDQPLEEEGRLACQMLLDRIQGFDGPPRFAVAKSTFIVGQSTTGQVLAVRPDRGATAHAPSDEAASVTQ